MQTEVAKSTGIMIVNMWHLLTCRSLGWLSKKTQDWGQTADIGGLAATYRWLWPKENYTWQKDGKVLL